MKEVLRRHHISFKNAFAGLLWAIRTQPNFRIHLILASLAIGLGIYLNVSTVEMAILIFAVVLGLTTEMINTSLESITDLVTHEWKPEAKIAKDVAAGMMLLTAVGAAGVALFIFWPYLSFVISPY